MSFRVMPKRMSYCFCFNVSQRCVTPPQTPCAQLFHEIAKHLKNSTRAIRITKVSMNILCAVPSVYQNALTFAFRIRPNFQCIAIETEKEISRI